MNMWTIYWSPADHVGKFVVRRFVITPGSARPTSDATVHETLEAARRALPPGLVRMERSESDPPHIVETWL